MWFNDCRLLVFLVLSYASVYTVCKETIIIRDSDEVKETVFNDVLQNITSANKILQDLIKNYEQLQNIYKSNEEKGKSSVSDTEEDAPEGIIKKSNSKESYNENTEATISLLRGRTQMIFEDDTVEVAEDQSSDTPKNDSRIVSSVNTQEFKQNGSEIQSDESSSQYEEIEETDIKFNISSAQNNNGKRNGKVSNKVSNINKKVQTRFHIKNHDINKDVKRNFNRISRPSLRLQDDGKHVKRVVYAEVFSPDNLWQEVISKPIDLKLYDEGVTFRVPNNERYIEVADHRIPETESSSDSKPEDEIEKEQLKSYLLRNAYGDACLQVAVRKCYKALKNVNRIVCRMQSKCKSSLKSSFKENSKKGCIKEFTNVKKNKSGEETIGDDIFDRRSKGDTDMSRYIELCLPAMATRTDKKNDDLHDTNDVIAINILRDRFEKACKKLSAKKCMKACKFATDAACSTNSCGSKKKAFSKTCKRECKSAYNLVKESSESDDDDDDSGSD